MTLDAWTLTQIRKFDSSYSWIEENRFEWSPIIHNVLDQLMEGKSILLVSDKEREWIVEYILLNINKLKINRPYLPFYNLRGMFYNYDEMSTSQDFDLLEDMLALSFPNGYIIWYIGSGDDKSARFPLKNENIFLWTIDSDVPNAFNIKNRHNNIDIKLLQLFDLFNSTVDAVLHNEVTL